MLMACSVNTESTFYLILGVLSMLGCFVFTIHINMLSYMHMKKVSIKNRKNQTIEVVLDKVSSSKGLAFVMHGLGGSKDQSHIKIFASSFKEKGYSTILFDTTNTFGESDGDYADATVTNYYEDLDDVIEWAKNEELYREPFFLVGHSLGGICTALYAEAYPEKVKGLAPISTLVSGKLSLDSPNKIDKIKEWKRTGWIIKESTSKPGRIKRLKWSHMEDRLKYDLLDNVDKLSMPVLMIVGDQDTSTPLEHQKILFDALPGKKELHVIKNAPHTFKDPKHLNEIKKIFENWINNID